MTNLAEKAERLGQAQARERRHAIIARAPLFASLTEPHRSRILANASLTICPGGKVLFNRGDIVSHVLLVGSGFVELRTLGAGPDDAAEAALQLRLAGPGELAAGDELATLAAGAAPADEHRQAAVVLGEPAEIVAIDASALAAWLSVDAVARLQVAQALLAHLAALQSLAAELAEFKNHGKIRLARYLDRLFDRMGQVRGGSVTLPHTLSHGDLAAALGLTRRSILDDMLSLEAFGAIDHDRAGRLTLRDRARLQRIAHLGVAEDRDADAANWREDVALALAQGDTLRGFELAREGLIYHPRDEELRYASVLAALRSGLLEQAESLIAAFRFDASASSEAVAALVARAQKERAFAALDASGLRHAAARAARAYQEVHARFGGSYSALNAAQLYCVAGETGAGMSLARGLTRGGSGYWQLTTRAEALWLLGDEESAVAAAQAARRAPDADEGKLATTRRQLRRLAAALGRDAGLLLDAPFVRPVIIGSAATMRFADLASEAARVFVVFDGPADCQAWGEAESLEVILPAPIALLPGGASPGFSALMGRAPCHVADGQPGPLTEARRLHARRLALGLALLCAAERETSVRCAGETGWPAWGAPACLAEGQRVVLWVSGASVPASVTAQEVHTGEDGAVLRFATPGEALAAARALSRQLSLASLCLDVEPAVTPLAESRLAQIQPALTEAGVFATDAAAAELALLLRPDLRLQSIGRIRSRRRMNRLRLWAVREAAGWA
jgi:CRP-like cAMP-binding protein